MPITIDGDSGVSGVNGSATTPALQGTDSNTGILFGTDTVQVATGGSTRATVDSSGRLGINTTSLVSKFTIDNGGRADPSSTGSTTQSNAALEINADSESNTRLMAGMNTSSKFWMQVQNTSGNTADDILLNPIGGNVGIGTTSPSSLIHGEVSSGNAILTLKSTATSGEASVSITGENSSGTARTAIFKYDNGDLFRIGTNAGIPLRLETNDTERLRLRADGRMLVQGVYDETTGGSENVNVQSDGLMQRSVSSIKYKKDVETLEDSYSDALLALRAVWYKSKCASDNPDWGYWGFIAEELAEIDPRLVIWKTEEISTDENGNQVKTACDPEPEGVQYSRFVPHLLNLIKRQKTKIETLETQYADLLARVTALEAA